ncbi:amidohydrolase family protein [Gordonia sp. CPCC 205515]|uniref:amidohydrolase family protein n=1 Tax=Gordonia sp. CPCC 205515 TaxID=3140791 RepID=UPI003AF35D0A
MPQSRFQASVIHAASVGAYDMAVHAGADFITHLPIDGPLTPGSLAAMKAAGQIAVPTTTMMSGILAGRAPLDGLLGNLRAVVDSGIEVLAGTDSNASPGVPAQIRHGSSLHEEFGFMAQVGMRPIDILRSATILPAQAFGLTDRGAIVVGKRADLVLIDGGPLAEIAATTAIRAVWCGGAAQSRIKL